MKDGLWAFACCAPPIYVNFITSDHGSMENGSLQKGAFFLLFLYDYWKMDDKGISAWQVTIASRPPDGKTGTIAT